MWKVCVAFIAHRFCLLIAAFFVINSTIPSSRTGALPEIHSTHQVWDLFLKRVSEGSEFAELDRLRAMPMGRVVEATPNPFFWVARWVSGITGMATSATLLFVSNLFLLLFLGELVALLSRMCTNDVAEGAAILIVLWPTSYEMSLGASLPLVAYLVALVVRQAIDNRWLIGGIAIAVLALMDPVALGLVPLLVYIFWYFQRHFQIAQVIKRTCFFLIPFGLALFWRWGAYPTLGSIFSQSALLNVVTAAKTGGLGWTVSRSYGGQTLTILFFGIGAGVSLFSNIGLMHRLIPVNMWLLLLLFSPYSAVASRAPIAAACLQGISSASSPPVLRLVKGLLFALGVYEVYLVFGGGA